MMSKKKADTSGIVVTETSFLNSKPFYVLLDLGTTHSFASTKCSLHLKRVKIETNYRIKLPNESIVKCPIIYKHVSISIVEPYFLEI